MRITKRSVFIVLLLLYCSSALAANPFSSSWSMDSIQLSRGQSFTIHAMIDVPENHYIYADTVSVEMRALDGMIIDRIDLPKGKEKYDQWLEETQQIYDSPIAIEIHGHVPDTLSLGAKQLAADIIYRGCSETLCYRKVSDHVSMDININAGSQAELSVSVAIDNHTGPQPKASAITDIKTNTLLSTDSWWHILLSLGSVFIAGILTAFTPCVWPVLPAILSFIGVSKESRMSKNLLLSISLIAGLALVYSLLGMLAASAGKNLGFLFQYKWFLVIVILFFILMSLSMLGVFRLSMPSRWQTRMNQLGGKGFLGAFLAGAGMGLVASPCAGPVIVAILGVVAYQRDYMLGLIMLLTYSAGMGIVFIGMATLFASFTNRLKGGKWFEWIKRSLAVLLLVPALYFAMSLFNIDIPFLSSDRSDYWHSSLVDAKKIAKEEQKPLFIKFSTKWCTQCALLDKTFFKESQVISLLDQMVPVKIDCTDETDAINSIIKTYGILGYPEFRILFADGALYEGHIMSAFEREKLLANMRDAIFKQTIRNKELK